MRLGGERIHAIEPEVGIVQALDNTDTSRMPRQIRIEPRACTLVYLNGAKHQIAANRTAKQLQLKTNSESEEKKK
jgi:hypothetical protein